MELTHPYIHKATSIGLRLFRRNLTTFINQNVDVFTALARQGTPFGGNWLSVD